MARGIIDSMQDTPTLTVEQAPEALMHTVMMPVTKLDADQYMAQDIDGVTESLFGSGNLNFMLLQSGQINGLSSENERLSGADHAALLSAGSYNAGSSFVPTINSSVDFSSAGTHSSSASAHGAPAFSDPVANFSQTSADPSSFSALPAAAASFPAAFQSAPALSAQDGVNGVDAAANLHDGSNGTNGANGFSGADGKDGKDGVSVTVDSHCCDCGGGTVINIDLGDVTNAITTTVTNVTDILNNLPIGDLPNLTDILNNITDLLGLGDVTNNLTDTVTNILNDVTSGDSLVETVANTVDTVSDTLNPVTDTVTDLTGQIGLDPLLSPVTDILANPGDLITDLVNDPVSTLTDTVTSALDPVTDVVGDLTGTLGLDPVLAPVTDLLSDPGALLADIASDPVSTLADTAAAIIEPVTDAVSDLSGTLGLDPVTEPVLDIVDTLSLDPVLNPIGDLLSDPLDTLGGLLGPADGAADTDVALDTGIPLLQDLGIDQAQNLILDPAENLTGDIDLGANFGLGLLGNNEDTGQDSDLTLGHDIALGDFDITADNIDIPLDAVESITGDIDLNILAATDLLSDTANNLTDNVAGGTGDGILLEPAGDLGADAADQILTGLGGGEGDLGILGQDGVSGILDQIAGGGSADPAAFNAEAAPDAASAGDPAASLTDIIDQTLDTAINLIGDTVSAASDAGSGGGLLSMLSAGSGESDIASWPENTITSGDASGGAIDVGGIDNILPDPAGSVAEGLHGLLGGGQHDSGSHGGLLGGMFG